MECKKYPAHSTYPSASNKTQESDKQIQEPFIGVKRLLDQDLNELKDIKGKLATSLQIGQVKLWMNNFLHTLR